MARLEKRQKAFKKHLKTFNRGGFSGDRFEFDMKNDDLGAENELGEDKDSSSERYWIGKTGLYGAYIVFELAPKYMTEDYRDTHMKKDGNKIQTMKQKVIDEETRDSIAVVASGLPQNLSSLRKDTKSLLIVGSRIPIVDSDLEFSGFTRETRFSKMAANVGLYESEII